MVNISQGAIAVGVLTLLFGGDIYSMFAGEPAEVSLYWADRCTTPVGYENVSKHDVPSLLLMT